MSSCWFNIVMAVTLLVVQPLPVAAADAPTDDWYPSRYGAADRLGALNNLGAHKAVEAAKLVTQGKVYSLAIVSSATTPTGAGRSYHVEAFPLFPGTMGENLLSGMDDRIQAHLGVGTQLDGMGHVGIGLKHYNGVPAENLLRDGRLVVFGMQDFPPVVTRGVLLDMAAMHGVARLAAGTPINRKEIDAAMARQGLRIGRGDVVLLHTGWLSLAEENPEAFISAEPGVGVEGAGYLAEIGVVAVGVDNHSFEHIPFADPKRPYEVHQTMLPRNGVYIMEFVKTAELARDRVYEFMIVLSPPRLDGTVQSIVNPVAIR